MRRLIPLILAATTALAGVAHADALRNIALSASCFHSGKVRDLSVAAETARTPRPDGEVT